MNKLKFLFITFFAFALMLSIYSCAKEESLINSDVKGKSVLTQTRGNGCPTSVDLQLSQTEFLRPGDGCGNILVTLNGLIENTKDCEIVKAEFSFRAKKPPFDWEPRLGVHTYNYQTSLPAVPPFTRSFWQSTLGVLIPYNVTPGTLGDGDSFVIETNNTLGFTGANTLETGEVEVCVKITVDCADCPEIIVCKTQKVFCG